MRACLAVALNINPTPHSSLTLRSFKTYNRTVAQGREKYSSYSHNLTLLNLVTLEHLPKLEKEITLPVYTRSKTIAKYHYRQVAHYPRNGKCFYRKKISKFSEGFQSVFARSSEYFDWISPHRGREMGVGIVSTHILTCNIGPFDSSYTGEARIPLQKTHSLKPGQKSPLAVVNQLINQEHRITREDSPSV